MHPTTVTNSDGTFSPAIKRSNGDRIETWVSRDHAFKSEDKAIKVARTNLKQIDRETYRMLVEGRYEVRS